MQTWDEDKRSPTYTPKVDEYEVFLATSLKPGKDNSGEYVYRLGPDNAPLLDDDGHDRGTRSRRPRPSVGGVVRGSGTFFLPRGELMAVWNSVSLSELRGAFRLDAEFRQPEYLETEETLLKQSHDRLGELVSSIRKGVFNILADSYVGDGVPFYRSSNVGQVFPNEGGLAFITPKRHAHESKTGLTRGDIMLAKTGKEAASVVLREACNLLCHQRTSLTQFLLHPQLPLTGCGLRFFPGPTPSTSFREPQIRSLLRHLPFGVFVALEAELNVRGKYVLNVQEEWSEVAVHAVVVSNGSPSLLSEPAKNKCLRSSRFAAARSETRASSLAPCR